MESSVTDDKDDMPDVGQLIAKQHVPQSPADRAKMNETHVVVERLMGELDAEQSKQALHALNGTDKSDE